MINIQEMHAYQAPEVNPVTVGKRIKKLRVENGFTIRDIQSYFGFNEPSAVYRWESGKTTPSISNLIALRDLYELPNLDSILCC